MPVRLFIGSSSEGLDVANALQEALSEDAEVTVWSQGVVEASQFILEGLLEELGRSDFGVFVFTPDDVATIRSSEQPVVRDNVLFELGMFVGRLGRRRAFFMVPKGVSLRIPSDLSGVVALTYDPARSDHRLVAAVGPAASKLRRTFEESVEADTSAELPKELTLDWFARRALLSTTQTRLLRPLEVSTAGALPEQLMLGMVENLTVAELFYRMEHLRLLGFVCRVRGASGVGYMLTGSYREVVERARMSELQSQSVFNTR